MSAFISESLPTEPATYQLMQDLFHVGHQPINAKMTPNGLIEYERGAAAVGITPHNEMILLSTTDIDDMEIVHRVVFPDGTIKEYGERSFRPYRDAEPRKLLANGGTYMGQFIKDKTNRDGDRNYDHILGIAAWKPTPRQLVHNLLNLFSNFHRQDLLESGILMHHNPLIWMSKELIYVAEPQSGGLFGRPKLNEKGEQLYALTLLAAPRKGWNTANLYRRLYGEGKEKGILVRSFEAGLRLMVAGMDSTVADMTYNDMEAHIKRTFSPTAKLLRQGNSPYTHAIEEDGTVQRKHGYQLVKGRAKRAFATAVFGLSDINRVDLLTGVALPAVLAVWGLLTEHEELTVTAALMPAVVVLARFIFLWATRSHHNFDKKLFEDLSDRFWPEGTKRKKVPSQFEMVRPDVLSRLRILPRHELNILSHVPTNRVVNTPRWDILYILGMQNGPYGSHSSLHKVGNQWVVRIEEEANSSGMSIEYWPALDIAFAKAPQSDHLPQRLLNEFSRAAHPIRMIDAAYDRHGSISRYKSDFISHERYTEIVAELAQRPAQDIYRRPECSPELRDGYPLKEVEEVRGEHGEASEWAQDSRASSLAEVFVSGLRLALRR